MQRAPLGFPLVTIVRVFLRNGNVFTVRCQKEEDTQKLAKALKALWKRRYSPDEIAARARVIPVLFLNSLFIFHSLSFHFRFLLRWFL